MTLFSPRECSEAEPDPRLITNSLRNISFFMSSVPPLPSGATSKRMVMSAEQYPNDPASMDFFACRVRFRSRLFTP